MSGGHTLSRARAGAVDRIVVGILEDMVSGKWVAGKSHRELAVMHSVSVERVKDWATEAGRTLRILALVDRDDLRARNAARLDSIVEMALNRSVVIPPRGENDEATVVVQPDLKAAVSAIAEQGKLLGLNAPEKVSVTAEDTLRQKYEAMSGEERCAWLRGEIQSLTEMLADEERKLGIVQSTNATQLQEQSECGTDEQGTR